MRSFFFFFFVEKIVFGEQNLDMCLLNKSKSFGFKKYQICFLKQKKKIGFLVKEKLDLPYDNKNKKKGFFY